MGISRRDLARQLADDMTTAVQSELPGAFVFLGAVGTLPDGRQVDLPTVSANDARVVPYTVIYPAAGIPFDDRDLAETPGLDLDWSWQVSTAAGYPADHLNLLDVVAMFCERWAPHLDGINAERAVQVNEPGPQRRDDTKVPPRWWLPLTYSQLITT